MSVSASISLRIIDYQLRTIASPVKIIRALINNGWNVQRGGLIDYIPLGSNDDNFNWKVEPISIELLMNTLIKKEQQGELIGVGVTWQDTYIGGTLLLWDEKKALTKKIYTPLSFSLSSDRKILIDYGHFKITNVNWYLEKLLPVLNNNDLYVASYTYEEDR